MKKRERIYICPKCKGKRIMSDYVSFLAPIYETYMCNKCGGIFYDLVDQSKLNEAIVNSSQYMIKKVLNK